MIDTKKPQTKWSAAFKMVPGGGFEPPRDCSHCDLNAARLPIPPLRRVDTNTLHPYFQKTNQTRRFFSWRVEKKDISPWNPAIKFAICYLNAVVYDIFSRESYDTAFSRYPQVDGGGGGIGGDGNDLRLDSDDGRPP